MRRRATRKERREFMRHAFIIVKTPRQMDEEDWEARKKQNRRYRTLRKRGVIV